MTGRIHIGTSGWHYPHWRERFYPSGMRPAAYLAHYLNHFSTVEINNSFYRLPERHTFEAWREATPPGFIFAVKASRYLTHMKKLKDPDEPLSRFYERVAGLADRVGPILFQTPPRWRYDEGRLREFLSRLDPSHRHAFEFRDVTWFHPSALEALRAAGCAFCIYDMEGMTAPLEVTASWVYVRLHGPGGKYQGRYGDERLAAWAARAAAWRDAGLDVYVYFDNDDSAYAVYDALDLCRLMQ